MEQAIVINIAKQRKEPSWDGKPQYRHHCRVLLDHLSDLSHVEEVVKELRVAYPAGLYQINVTRWVHRGERLSQQIEGCDVDR